MSSQNKTEKEKQTIADAFNRSAKPTQEGSNPSDVAEKSQDASEATGEGAVVETSTTGTNEIAEAVWKLTEEQKRRKTVEETHTRMTVLVEDNLLKELNALAKKHGRGGKTRIVNQALRVAIDQLKKLQ